MTARILAGQIAYFGTPTDPFVFPALVTGSVNPSTAKMAVTGPDGTTTSITPTVAYDAGNTQVRVNGSWTIPDSNAGGRYVLTIDISGNMVAAYQEAFYVEPRTLPTVP